MIQKLCIRNYAIIEELEINFSEQLTIITGETGAGKSILLGALGMILGNRADTKVLYNEKEKCVIEAYFDISKYSLDAFFEEHEIENSDSEAIVRRELTPQGKTRTFINDTPVNLQVLRQFTSQLVDLHQQFDTADIHAVSFQVRMIDALADNKALLEQYQTLFKDFQTNRRTLADLQQRSQNSVREVEYIQFQLTELDKASLQEGEQERIEAEMQKLNNAENIKRTMGGAFRALSEAENSLISQLQSVGQGIGSLRKVSQEINEIHEKYDGLVLEIQDLADELERIAEDTEHDAERISEIQNRLDTIYKLQKKYAVPSVTDLLNIQNDLQQKLEGYGDLSHDIQVLETLIAQQSNELWEKANELSERRKAVTVGFEQKVEGMLQQLSMENARLQVQMNVLADLNTLGKDDIQFLFAANKGSRMNPIKDVASGGELSRLTLCIKSLVASAIPLPTLIFDEIDSGVSGDVALKMGNILQKLASHHQVVVITHSPQVASKADTHYFVYKTHREDRTITNVRLLNADERIRSIATMLSQSPPSASAMENAKELLGIG